MAKVKYRIREFKPTANQTGGNAYDWFTAQVFCDGWGEFVERFGRSELFDDKIDTKKYLESEFGIEL